jgi:hypothetical protein
MRLVPGNGNLLSAILIMRSGKFFKGLIPAYFSPGNVSLARGQKYPERTGFLLTTPSRIVIHLAFLTY